MAALLWRHLLTIEMMDQTMATTVMMVRRTPTIVGIWISWILKPPDVMMFSTALAFGASVLVLDEPMAGAATYGQAKQATDTCNY